MENDPSLPYSRIAAFLRQHAHDVRNNLNGLDLEAALLADIVTDEEAREAVTRLRAQIREAAGGLRALSAKLADPQPSCASISAQDLFLIWQDEAARLGLGSIVWASALGGERANVDATAMAAVFRELLTNAKQFGDSQSLVAMANICGTEVVFELREPAKEALNPSEWGRTPFVSTRRGSYGLGLWEADRLVRACGGEVTREVLSDGKLVTKLSFPLEH